MNVPRRECFQSRVPSLALALTFARVFGCATDEIFELESLELEKQA